MVYSNAKSLAAFQEFLLCCQAGSYIYMPRDGGHICHCGLLPPRKGGAGGRCALFRVIVAVVLLFFHRTRSEMWWPWPWPWSWEATALAAAAWLLLHLAVARVMEALWWRPRRLERHFASHGVRGPGYRFFFGSSIELIRLMVDASSRPAPPEAPHDVLPRVLAFFYHWRKLYGPMHLIWFGSTPRLVVSQPELIREVLISRAEHFDRYEAHPLIRQFEGVGLSNLHGDEWARRRKILTPGFNTENLKLLVPFVGETVQRMLEDRVLSASGGGGGGEVVVDVADWYQRLPQDVMTLATFGRNYDEGSVVFQLQGEHGSYATEAHSKVFIPGYRFIPTKKNRRVWQLDREIKRLLGTFVNGLQSGDHRSVGGRDHGMKDFMSFMAPAMSVDQIIEESKNFFFAGKETLTSLLTWATVALAMHPDWQDRARQEVVDVCGGRWSLPTKDHLPRLKTIGMIVNETLRLYPPAVAMIRKVKEDVRLGGCVVPAGTEIMMPIMAVHHDAEVWGADATEFNPGRFADDRDRPPRQQMAFLPFGGGGRVCIGQNLAVIVAKVALALVLQRCELRPSPAYVHAPRVLMILNPQHGAPVIFRPLCPPRTA